ncbi:zinc finger CCCH domain-containing protein 39-like [Silene latifolia]|uniref:zinc finger CCCH domain-containing protein 39-like n=1 Tax=Silene latifolia TaxID=37657 RepID=UPI003D780EF3
MDARSFARHSSSPSYGVGIDLSNSELGQQSNVRDDVRPNSNTRKEICRRFRTTGCCHYGENCIFAHVSNDGMILKSTNEGSYQRPICNYFSRGMRCPYERCKYVHQKLQGSVEKRDMPRESASISIQRVEDRDATYMKTRLCNKWSERKSCQYGDKCTFAHGLAELRRSNPTLRTINNNDAAPNSDEQPAPYDRKVPSKPKVCPFKWNYNKKIIGIYADWIDEDSLGSASSSQQQ